MRLNKKIWAGLLAVMLAGTGLAQDEDLLAEIVFPPASPVLDETQKASLEAIAARLADDKTLRLLLTSTASEGEAVNGFAARTLALDRGLAVRAWLVQQGGVKANRMIIRPEAVAGEGGGKLAIHHLEAAVP